MLTIPAVDRNIIIIFDDKLTNEFITFSQKINRKVPSRILLNKINEIPHMTLYMTRYPEKNVDKVLDKIREIASSIKPFELFLNKKSCHPSGTIFIDAVLNNTMYKLHETLVDNLNPLREGLYNEDELKLLGMTDKMKKSIIDYGMWAVKKDYIPHVSIARINPQQDKQTALEVLPEEINYKIIVKEIAFAIIGHDGTCNKILDTFKLG